MVEVAALAVLLAAVEPAEMVGVAALEWAVADLDLDMAEQQSRLGQMIGRRPSLAEVQLLVAELVPAEQWAEVLERMGLAAVQLETVAQQEARLQQVVGLMLELG